MKLLALFFLLFLSCLTNIHSTPTSPIYNAIFSFGDSFFDTGNFVAIKTPVMKDIWVTNPPYGETFFHRPTGRCCDGRLVLDFLAEELGLPFVPAYLAHNGSFNEGANFAVGAATAMDYAFFLRNNMTNSYSSNSSLNVQLGWFDELKPSLCNTSEGCEEYFSKSLFVVGEFGTNDYQSLLSSGLPVEGFVSVIIEIISNAIQNLIDQGARTIVVADLWPQGCTSAFLFFNMNRPEEDYEPQTGCLKESNNLSMYHNSVLLNAANKLKRKNPHVRLIYADYYRPIMELVKSPKSFGFIKNPLGCCCGKGDNKYNFNASVSCGMPGVSSCKNPSNYMNWDGIHFTEAVYQYISSGWLRGPYADPPILSTADTSLNVMSNAADILEKIEEDLISLEK